MPNKTSEKLIAAATDIFEHRPYNFDIYDSNDNFLFPVRGYTTARVLAEYSAYVPAPSDEHSHFTSPVQFWGWSIDEIVENIGFEENIEGA